MASIARVENRHREQGAHPHGTDLPRTRVLLSPERGGRWGVPAKIRMVLGWFDSVSRIRYHRTVLEKSDLTDSVIDNETLKGAQVRGAQPMRSTSRCIPYGLSARY